MPRISQTPLKAASSQHSGPAAAIGGAHHHHGHHHAASSSTSCDNSTNSGNSSSPSSSSASSGSSNATAQSLSQLLRALGANTQNSQFDPQSIIFSTLVNAGVIPGNSAHKPGNGELRAGVLCLMGVPHRLRQP